MVLIFPPVNNYRRFLIHKICENLQSIYDVATFSIGQGFQRRTVICSRKHLALRNEKFDEQKFRRSSEINDFTTSDSYFNFRKYSQKRIQSGGKSSSEPNRKMGIENNNYTNDGCPVQKSKNNNCIGIYRPPAARRLSALTADIVQQADGPTVTVERIVHNGKTTTINNDIVDISGSIEADTTNVKSINASQNFTSPIASTDSSQTTSNQRVTPRTRERRPDRAVYVPRARRSQTTPPTSTTTIQSPPIPTPSIPNQSLINTDNTNLSVISNCSIANNLFTFDPNIDSNKHVNCMSTTNNCDVVTYVSCDPKKSLTHCTVSDANVTTNCNHFQNNSDNRLTVKYRNDNNSLAHLVGIDSENLRRNNNLPDDCRLVVNGRIGIGEMGDRMKKGQPKLPNKSMRIEDYSGGSEAHLKDNQKFDRDEREFQRVSKEINRSNRRIIKQTFNSNVLEIPGEQPVNGTDKSGPDFDPETDDWERMFNDNGDLDLCPKLMDELTSSIGKVAITTPKSDYKLYHANHAVLSGEEFPHVLEVSNFPPEFKTQDLMLLFSQYKESGFDIKWVDDTHALAVFSSSRIAAEVLTMGHTFVKMKPLTDATVESRAKAKKCSGSLQPYRQRPETCAALARRLVTGALGVRLKTAREERENERRVLREAKERKLLAAKQREEMWES